MDRDELEDLIENVLDGDGEVTGAGGGLTGHNIDIEIYRNETESLLKLIEVLKNSEMAEEDYLVVDGERIYPFRNS